MVLSLSGERPHAAAMSASLSPAGLVSRLARWVAKAHAARVRRTALATLLELDHCRLDDLGIDRQDIIEAMRATRTRFGHGLNAARAARARL